jgi:hypothetical protein
MLPRWRRGELEEGTPSDERSAIEEASQLTPEVRPGISLNRSRPRLHGECERQPAHGIERDAEPPRPLGARDVREIMRNRPERGTGGLRDLCATVHDVSCVYFNRPERISCLLEARSGQASLMGLRMDPELLAAPPGVASTCSRRMRSSPNGSSQLAYAD